MEINVYHDIIGHVNEGYLRATAKHYGLQLYGTLKPCVPCSLAKVHAKPISKQLVPRSTNAGTRIFIDISTFPTASIAGNKHWMLVLDDATDMVWSMFLKTKAETTERMLGFFSKMKDRGTPVHRVRLDNSGENRKLRDSTQHMNIHYEFTAPNTPQQNGRVERKFAILYEYMRSMLNSAQLPEELRQKLWAEAAHHATDITNGICTTNNPIPPYKKFYKVNPPYFPHLKTFGEIAVFAVKVNKKISAKTDNRGNIGLYLGRAPDHSVDTHRMYNLATQRVLLSRNVRFMKIKYQDYFNTSMGTNRYSALIDYDDAEEKVEQAVNPSHAEIITTPIDIIDEDDLHMPVLIPDEEKQVVQTPTILRRGMEPVPKQRTNRNTEPLPTNRSAKQNRELKRLAGFFNPAVMKALKLDSPTTQIMTREPVAESPSPILEIDDLPQEIHDSNLTIASPLSDSPYEQEPNIFDQEPHDPNDQILENTAHIITNFATQPSTDETEQHMTINKAMSMTHQSDVKHTKQQPTIDTTNPTDTNPYRVNMSQLKDVLPLPSSYEEAMYGADLWCQKRWQAAIKL
jgi:hypothetical protein